MEPFDVNDFRRWRKIPRLPAALIQVLERYPVFADRAMHEIERLWKPEYASLSRKAKLRTYDGTWLNQYSAMQRNIALDLARYYCDYMESSNESK